MKSTMKVDTGNLRRLLRDMEKAGPAASVAVVKRMGAEFTRTALAVAPEDTGRYKRGWALAANTAGIGPFSVPGLRPSKHRDKLLARLETQAHRQAEYAEIARKDAEYWHEVYLNRYERTGRKGQWERDCAGKRDRARKRAEKAAKRAERAKEQLELLRANPEAIVIWGRSREEGPTTELATVRAKIYGGTGRVVATPGGAYVVLHNLEAHASIVEKNQRVVARAFASVRRPGLVRRAGSKALREALGKLRRGNRVGTRD